MTETPVIWNVKRGRLVEVKTNDGDVFPVRPELDLTLLQASGYTLDQIGTYLRIYVESTTHPSVLVAPSVETNDVLPEDTSIELVVGTQEKPIKNARKLTDERRQHLSEVMLAKRKIPENVFAMPKQFRTSCPWAFIPKDVVYHTYTIFSEKKAQGQLVKPVDVYKDKRWMWKENQHQFVNGILVVWASTGAVKRQEKGIYELSFPSEKLKEYCARKGADITPEMVADEFWVPIDAAKEYLERLTKEHYVEKHVRHDKWSIKNVPLAKAHIPPPVIQSKNSNDNNGNEVQEIRWPDAKEFSFSRADYQCRICCHNYGHGYKAGQFVVCGGCYRNHFGGTTHHGKDRTVVGIG